MRTLASLSIISVVAALLHVEAFTNLNLPRSQSPSTVRYAYVPDGFTLEEYKKFKEEEKAKLATKNLGGVGPRGFKSRSMQSFQEALERGEAAHLMPVFNAKEKLARGELKQEDIPYMQRGGAWDNSDVAGAKRKKWLSSDKEYAAGGYKKEQSVSIFGGSNLDWTGTQSRTGPGSGRVAITEPKFSKNYKAPNVFELQKKAAATQKKNNDDEKPKKSLFGIKF